MSEYSRYETLKIDVGDHVATVTLNRPERLNAVNDQMHRELEELFGEISSDDAINAIVLTGAGRAFCAGGDIRGMNQRAREGSRRIPLRGAKRLIQNMWLLTSVRGLLLVTAGVSSAAGPRRGERTLPPAAPLPAEIAPVEEAFRQAVQLWAKGQSDALWARGLLESRYQVSKDAFIQRSSPVDRHPTGSASAALSRVRPCRTHCIPALGEANLANIDHGGRGMSRGGAVSYVSCRKSQ